MQLSPKIIGKHFIVGLEGISLSDSEIRFLDLIQPSGIIIFARNFSTTKNWRSELIELINSAKNASKNSIKLVSIDFEGGRVNRFPADIQRFPYAQDWRETASETSNEMGLILSDLGFNFTYGPVADLDLNTCNPVIGKRSFSADKLLAANACESYVEAYNQLNILTCAKHFPGHGRTSLDSHFELPIVDCSLTELQTDLFPFIQLINRNVPFIMPAHVIFECLDKKYPATLSKIIQTDLLRNQLNFEGLIVSDDMDMKALANYSGAEKTKIALEAGTDFLLFGNGMDSKALETTFKIVEELKILSDDKIFRSSLESSSNRIDRNFKRLNLI